MFNFLKTKNMKCKYCEEEHKNDNTGCRNSGDRNSGDRNSGHWNSGDRNSGHWNSGYRNSGNMNSGDRNSGHWNSGDRNSGHWNSGDYNSGYFNTNSPDKVRIFNTWVDMTHEEFNEEYNTYMDIPLNTWIDKSEMSEKEKSEVKGWETMGGYLKTLEFKEACRIWWKDNPNDHERFLKLPNFNWDIFTEITGIEPEDDKKKAMLQKADELIAKANELKKEAEKL